MVNSDLVNHVENELNKGTSKEELKDHLKKWDYSQKEIDEALKFIEFKKAHHLYVPKTTKNQTNVIASVLGVFVIALLLSMGTLFLFGSEEEIEMYASEQNITEKEPELFKLFKTESSVTINLGESKKFIYKNKEHLITLDATGQNYADLIISSDPIKFSIYVGENIPVDIDGDNINDISLKLVLSDRNRINFKIKELDQPEKPKEPEKKLCRLDSDCDDNLVNTIDECVWENQTKVCSNKLRDPCEEDSDCDYVENMTGVCIKSSILPYCEFFEPDLCINDSDCDDDDDTTEDTCLIFRDSTNYCEHKYIYEIDCGKTEDLDDYDDENKSIDDDEALKCFGEKIKSDFDLEIDIVQGNFETKMRIERLEKNESRLTFEFESIEILSEKFKDKELECIFDDKMIVNLSEVSLFDEAETNADKTLFIYLNILTMLEWAPYELRDDCSGSILNIIDPLPSWDPEGKNCKNDEECWLKELKDCSKSYYYDYVFGIKSLSQIEGVEQQTCVVNVSYLSGYPYVGTSQLCKIPFEISETGDIDEWYESENNNCVGSTIVVADLMINAENCVKNSDCVMIYTKSGEKYSINNESKSDYENWLERLGETITPTFKDGKEYTPYCSVTENKCGSRWP